MNYIKRHIEAPLLHSITQQDKVVVIYGPRQAGKTTLLQTIQSRLPGHFLFINADEQKFIDVLSSRDLKKMQTVVSGYQGIIVDEAQRVPDIGLNLKILHDGLPSLKIIATGSSSFELANKVSEPLTGRVDVFTLLPISIQEQLKHLNTFEVQDNLEQYLIYGAYPEILNLTNIEDKARNLATLSSSYLYKDIFELSTIKYPRKIQDLLRLLAYQIGSEVSLNEVANSLQLNKSTVASYIDLLEKTFVLFRLSGFSRNLRKEVTKSDKLFFYDVGVRNAIINDFRPLTQRNDIGQLWENFVISERIKKLRAERSLTQSYFWRTYTGAELDYIESANNQYSSYEIKYTTKKSKAPNSWTENYPNSEFELINTKNFVEFLK